MKKAIRIFSFIILGIAGCVSPEPTTGSNHSANPILVKSIKNLEEKGGRLTISPDGSMIAYDKRGQDGYYDIWTMKVDGSDKKCLTCKHPELPTRNVGQPEWHPSGKYIVKTFIHTISFLTYT